MNSTHGSVKKSESNTINTIKTIPIVIYFKLSAPYSLSNLNPLRYIKLPNA